MAITELYHETATVSTTEYSLPNDANYSAGSAKTDDGIFQVFIEMVNMAAGDEYQIRIYEKVRSTTTQRIIYEANLVGAQVGPFVSIALILLHGWDVTMRKVTGTDRAFDWSIRQVA